MSASLTLTDTLNDTAVDATDHKHGAAEVDECSQQKKLAPFLDEIVFVGGATLGLLITDEAAAPIRGTTDVDVIAEILTYADYIAFSERLRQAHFTEDCGLICR